MEAFGNAFSTDSRVVSYKYNDALDYYLDNVLTYKISKVDLVFYDSSKLKDKINYMSRVL